MSELGVVCGQCGGPGYFETCRQSRPTDHDFAIAFECQQCGARHVIVCPDCADMSSTISKERPSP